MKNCTLWQVLHETEGFLGAQGQENLSVCPREAIQGGWRKESQYEKASRCAIEVSFYISAADSARFCSALVLTCARRSLARLRVRERPQRNHRKTEEKRNVHIVIKGTLIIAPYSNDGCMPLHISMSSSEKSNIRRQNFHDPISDVLGHINVLLWYIGAKSLDYSFYCGGVGVGLPWCINYGSMLSMWTCSVNESPCQEAMSDLPLST